MPYDRPKRADPNRNISTALQQTVEQFKIIVQSAITNRVSEKSRKGMGSICKIRIDIKSRAKFFQYSGSFRLSHERRAFVTAATVQYLASLRMVTNTHSQIPLRDRRRHKQFRFLVSRKVRSRHVE